VAAEEEILLFRYSVKTYVLLVECNVNVAILPFKEEKISHEI
jgi:hypothetical protein